MKNIRLILWLCVAVIAALLLIRFIDHSPAAVNDVSLPIAGPFMLVNQHGKTVTEKDIQDKPSMIFFGFTSCPSVCPGTLADMTNWLEKLGKDADKINAVFITVDPERDTVKQIAEYLQHFDKRIIGLTGSVEQVNGVEKAYHIYAKKIPMDGGDYMVDHSATIYLFDKDGKLVSTIDNMENRDYALAKVKKLVSESK